jgi:hypothetical protein
MAPVTCRRRRDGIVEIVPPTALQRFFFDFRSAFVAMALLAALTVTAAAYALLGPAVLLVVVGAALGFALRQRGRSRQRAAAAAAHRPQRRSAL